MGKYFKYAVGEILLVVIGILIALQINNINQTYQNKKKETGYLKDMETELLNDKKRLDRFIVLTSVKADAGRQVKAFLKGQDIDEDLVLKNLFFNGRTLIFRSFTPVYDELVSSGQMGIIKNDSLKSALKEYKDYISVVNDFLYKESSLIKDRYNLHMYKYFDHEIMTILWETGYTKDATKITEKLRKDFDGFKKDPDSYYHVSTTIGTDTELNRVYKEGITNRITKVLEILNTKEIE